MTLTSRLPDPMSRRAYRFWCALHAVGFIGEVVFFKEGPLSRFYAKVFRLHTDLGRVTGAALVIFFLPHLARSAERLLTEKIEQVFEEQAA